MTVDLASVESQFTQIVNKQLELKQLNDQEIFQDFIEDLIDEFEVSNFFVFILKFFPKFDKHKSQQIKTKQIYERLF